MSFVPGEPVPPGFEEDMACTAFIKQQIEEYDNGALLGTEYAVELHEPNQQRPDYFCVLCGTCNDCRSIFVHWTSFTHRIKYLEAHFQKAVATIKKLHGSSTLNQSPELAKAICFLIEAIEQKFGRDLNLTAMSGEDFRPDKMKVFNQVRRKYHCNESAGGDFVNEAREAMLQSNPLLQKDETLKITIKLNDHSKEAGFTGDDDTIALDAISSDDDDLEPTLVEKQRKLYDEQSSVRGTNRSPPNAAGKKGSIAKIKQKLPTPKELSLQASNIAQERYKWEKFRCMLELQLKQLRDETEMFELNPEKHPDYSEEWKLFWNRRYKQLQEEKKCDPNRYDYKPEWISYWKERRVELFDIQVNKIKKELKEKFKLGDEEEEKTLKLMERYKIRVDETASRATSSPEPPAAPRRKPNFRNNRPETVVISDDEHGSPPRRNNRNRTYERSRSNSRSSSLSKRSGRPAPRLGQRTRSRSPNIRRDHRHGHHNSRSRSRSPFRRSHERMRGRDREHDSRERNTRSNHSRSRDGYSQRRSTERDYFRESYARSTRNYESIGSFRVLDSSRYPEYNHPKRSLSPNHAKERDSPVEPEGPLTVVSVLRMLSALEEHLGSLGPKALNLLGKALAMEKVQPNAADDLLLNEDNCVFLETTKEKLKGILIAEVIDDPQKVRVVKKLITNIAAIIFQVTKGGTKTADGAKAVERPKEYQLPFDRQVVSSKLAAGLLKNGIDTVTTEDMNKMVHFFTLLVKTHKMRRQSDKSSLHFAEVPARLGIKTKERLEENLSEIIKEVEQHLSKEVASSKAAAAAAVAAAAAPKPMPSGESGGGGMECLTDSDLQTLLQNFKFLSMEEQVHLIAHLRKLEMLEPARVEHLRKYINITELSGDGESCSDFLTRVIGNSRTGADATATTALRASPAVVSGRRKSNERDLPPPGTREKSPMRGVVADSPKIFLDDDDDDDYNFDDLIMKAKDSNGQLEPNIIPMESATSALTFKPAPPKISLKDTENIIANLMDTLVGASNQKQATVQPNNDRGMHNATNMMQMPQRMSQPFGRQQNIDNGQMYQRNYENEQNMGQADGAGQYGGGMQQPYNMSGGYGGFNNMAAPVAQQNFGGFAGQMNVPPWANNGPPQYNNMQQNYMQHQQQPNQPYNNMYGHN